MDRSIIINLRVEGYHRYPAAPAETKFLADLHRHIFHITAEKNVSHNNRDIEFVALKWNIEKYFKDKFPDKQFGEMSCEDIAEYLCLEFELDSCTVMEDGENGAKVKR
jgi:hypothetical protein